MNKEDLTRLKDGLFNPRADIRKKALSELKKLPTDEALQLLVAGLGEKSDDIQADLTRSFLSYKSACLPYLVRAFSHPTWSVRRAASRIIGALGDSALREFLELVPKNEEDVDYWMVQTLGLMGGEATHYLIKAFSHPNLRIRVAAVRAAGNVNDPQVVPPLLNLLEENRWPLRKAAYDSLEKVHPMNPEAVNQALQNASPEAKFWVIKLAGQRKDPQLLPLFTAIVDADADECKLEAVQNISLIETPEAQKILLGYLSHRSWIIRKTAAEAIWRQGMEVSDDLLSAVAAPDVDTRYWTVKILGRTNEPKVFSKIIERLRDAHASVRSAACQALGTLGDKRALAPLMSVLSDPSEEVRTNAVLAISQIGERDDGMVSAPSVPSHLKPENQTECPHCGKKVGINFTFCPFCLGHLKTACKKCGRPIDPEWKGCPDCGEPV